MKEEENDRGEETGRKWKTEIEMKDGRMLSHGRQVEGGGRRTDRHKEMEGESRVKNERVKRAIIAEP